MSVCRMYVAVFGQIFGSMRPPAQRPPAGPLIHGLWYRPPPASLGIAVLYNWPGIDRVLDNEERIRRENEDREAQQQRDREQAQEQEQKRYRREGEG